jgi:hypothetical protein
MAAPNPNGRVKVHNAELFVECMNAADWSDAGTGVKRAPKEVVVQKEHASHSSILESTINTTGAKAERVAKQREAFLEKQSVREKEFQQKFDVARRETERRQKERQLAKEKDFEARFIAFVERNHRLVNEVEGAIQADATWRQRKKERLYNEWTAQVFQPMQDSINEHLAKTSDFEIEERRRAMFQCFLEESNRKANGLFRDIIIESDYDPLAQAAAAVVKYQPVSIAVDPTKNRGTREMGDQVASGLLRSLPVDGRAEKFKRGALPVALWDHVEVTPYGRYSGERANAKKPDFNKSDVCFEHYAILRGAEGKKVSHKEHAVKGKKMVEPTFSSDVAECFRNVGTPPLPPVPRALPRGYPRTQA